MCNHELYDIKCICCVAGPEAVNIEDHGDGTYSATYSDGSTAHIYTDDFAALHFVDSHSNSDYAAQYAYACGYHD